MVPRVEPVHDTPVTTTQEPVAEIKEEPATESVAIQTAPVTVEQAPVVEAVVEASPVEEETVMTESGAPEEEETVQTTTIQEEPVYVSIPRTISTKFPANFPNPFFS
jgi:hypothetical protein